MEQMEKHGYHQYEISNFAKKGFESHHNLTYWNNEPYYGFGAGAHSYLERSEALKFWTIKKIYEPIEKGNFPLMEEHVVTEKEMGRRNVSGITENERSFRCSFFTKIWRKSTGYLKMKSVNLRKKT